MLIKKISVYKWTNVEFGKIYIGSAIYLKYLINIIIYIIYK